MRWLYLWSSYGELAGGGRSVGRYAGSWSYIQESTQIRENEGTTDNLRCKLYSVCAAVGDTSWWWHGEVEREALTLCSCNDGRAVDEKETDEVWRWARYGGFERIWQIWGATCQIWFRRHCIGVITRRIRTRTCRIGDGKLTRTSNSLKSQSLMMISPISSDLSLACA